MTEGGKQARLVAAERASSPFAPFRPLLAAHEQDPVQGLHKFAAALQGIDRHARLHVQFAGGGETVEHWSVEGGAGPADVTPGAPEHSDVHVVLRRVTWLAIAHGSLSPFDALFGGRLRFGGDADLAKRIAQHLSDPNVPFVSPCF